MNSKENKGMCALVENGLYGGDDFELPDGLDLPDNLEGDGCIQDWSEGLLGPIPADIFAEVQSVTHVGDIIGNGNYGAGGGSMDFRSTNVKESFKSQLQQHSSTFFDERKMCRIPKSFEAPSPDSVLERLMATSSGKPKTIPLGPEVTIPVKARTNRSRPVSTSNPWLNSLLLVPLEKAKKKRRLVSELPETEDKICTHCSTTQTPQWREGPMGPKTLCNACGVRYRSGRLLPEYRPAASPTFIPSLHSNSHRKVIEIRQKGVGIDGSPFAKKSRTAISYPVGAGKGFFLRKPTATTMSYPVGAGDGVFMKNPTIATMPYLVEARNGVLLKKPTAATVSYSVGAGDGVIVKKPTAATGPYSVGAGDGVFAKKPPYPAGAGDGVFMKQPATATATIPFPAGAGYGVLVNKSMGSVPTLTRLGSD